GFDPVTGEELQGDTDPQNTIIQAPANLAGEVVTMTATHEMVDGVEYRPTIEGFTIRGNGPFWYGIYVPGTSPTIKNNIIDGSGWGVCVTGSGSPTIDGNVIGGNYWSGIRITDSATPTVKLNIIKNNTWGGISVSGSAEPEIIANVVDGNLFGGVSVSGSASAHITYNQIKNNALGGVFILGSAWASVTYNIIESNTLGGISVSSSAPSWITYNTIRNNLFRGISVSGSSSTINNNSIEGNFFGGISVRGSASPLIYQNTVHGNAFRGISVSDSARPEIANTSVAGSWFGWGIRVTGSGAPTIEKNEIWGNGSTYFGGGAISVSDSASPSIKFNRVVLNNDGVSISGSAQSMVVNNVIQYNKYSGVYASGSTHTVITNNTISNNTWYGVFGSGLDGVSDLQVYNNIVTSSVFGVQYIGIGNLTVSHNNVWGNNTNYAGIPNQTGINGNVSENPKFVNPPVDYHLQETSPCIDAGMNDAPRLPDTDFDGNLRIIDGNDDGTPVVDMGAFEYGSPPLPGYTKQGYNVRVRAVDPSGEPTPVTLTFSAVTAAGTTTAERVYAAPGPLTYGFGVLGRCYDVSTTATYEPSITVEITYDDSGLTKAQESQIRLWHYFDGAWNDITTFVDTTNNVVYGQTNTLSVMAVVRDVVLPESSVNPISPYWQRLPFTIAATATDIPTGVAQVGLFYRYSTDNRHWLEWTSYGTNRTSPYSWSFKAPRGDGYYEFYTLATDAAFNVEHAPERADLSLGVDTLAPVSSVDPIDPCWQNVGMVPFEVTVTAEDPVPPNGAVPSGIRQVELFYRYSSDNSTWSEWRFYGADSTAPYSLSFTTPNGDGYYEFYSVAIDIAENVEEAPKRADAVCRVDVTPPITTISLAGTEGKSGWWLSDVRVALSANDATSGVANVQLFYRSSIDNASWTEWKVFGGDDSAPYEWQFTAPDSYALYEFYSVAADVAGNVESAPDVADAACGFSIPAAVDIDPDTLNLKGNGRWITAYIELPQGYDVRNVDISSIKLNNAVASESGQSYGFVKDPEIRDRDADGLPELMVKFDRAAVQALASVGDVKLTVTGKWHAVLFEGSDNIRVIDPGRGQGSGNSHAVSHGHSGGNSGQGPPQTPPGQGGTPPGQSSNQNQGNNG
ncbi:MAG: right-handed parallel beta-helix repeat-containing protein, partial [Candidatus Zixiibacteriota bacterium]